MKKSSVFGINWGLLTPVLILVIFSLSTLFSIDIELFRSQLIFFLISIFFYLFFSQTNFKSIRLYAFPIYIISAISLIVVLLIGAETRGSVRWIEFFGFGIQFSEIVKPFLAISLASYLALVNNYSLKTMISAAALLLPVAFLVFLQPDLGNALVYIIVAIFTFIIYGFPISYFMLGAVGLVLLTPIFWNILHDYQKQRIFTFINPSDPLGISYNAIQSIIAVGSGMFFGRGFGQGTQSSLRFLPERHTDFIFATLSEELGLLGAFIVICVFLYLLYKIYTYFRAQEEIFPKIYCAIAFSLIFTQFFINIGMNIGILPIVGITLPFISYGGSSLLSNFILLGILSSIIKEQKAQKVLEIG